jgi:predicted carbohydrate-binding protein with CBM48
MLTKRPLADGTTEVTFHMPASEWITTLSLLGDFNQWNVEAHPMTRTDDGSWSITVALTPGAYRFRYFANGENWANDDGADGLVDNEYGSANSLVQIEDVSPDAKSRTESAGTEGARIESAEPEAPVVVKKARAKSRTDGDAPAPKAKRAPAKSRTEGLTATAPKRTTRK